jgi:hypothetical protein
MINDHLYWVPDPSRLGQSGDPRGRLSPFVANRQTAFPASAVLETWFALLPSTEDHTEANRRTLANFRMPFLSPRVTNSAILVAVSSRQGSLPVPASWLSR